MQRHHEKSAHQEDREERHEGKDRHGAIKVQNAILALNHMSYDAPVSSSNSTDRIQMNFPFNPQSYQGVNSSTNAQVIFNTGANFINAATSSVVFDVTFTGAPTTLAWSFGADVPLLAAKGATPKSGSSAVNLFQEISVKLRGGEFPLRAVDANILSAAVSPFKKGQGAENLWGECGGASWNSKTDSYKFPIWYCRDTVQFEVPLSKLCPGSMFSEASPLPPSLISGATLYLKFANMLQAMCFFTVDAIPAGNNGRPPAGVPVPTTPGAGVALNVNNMQLMLDSMTVFDSSLALVNAKASSLASSGCQYDFYGVWQNKTTLVTGSANIDLMVSASQLKSVILSFVKPLSAANGQYDAMARLPLLEYDPANIGTSIWQTDGASIGKVGAGSSSIRLRIGSNYLTLTPQQSAGQTFRYTYQAITDLKGAQVGDIDPLNCINKPVDLGVSYSDWYYGTGCTTIAFDLSKSALLGLANTSTNNSRSVILELQGINAGAGAAAIELYVHCQMVKVINSSLENNIVDT